MRIVCVIFVFLFWQCSAPDYSEKLKFALQAARNNRPELEKVLAHYAAHPEDSLKWQAACFLIENMPGHYSLTSPLLESYYAKVDTIKNIPYSAKKLMQIIPYNYPEFRNDLQIQEDVKCITADFLIHNIDLAFLIVTIKEPETSTTFIDRFLATAEAYGIRAVIVINKTDLLDEEELQYAEAMRYLYSSIGYDVIMMSATSNDAARGIDSILQLATGRISLFSGNSGVGKSTIINLLIPGAGLKVGSISATHHTGMHTTTFSEMFPLPAGGYIIDTPGIKGFGTIDFDKSQVAHYFPEIFRIAADCRYYNCTHTHEPGCAVRQAVEDALISQSRYTSYLSILEDSTESKYRKPY